MTKVSLAVCAVLFVFLDLTLASLTQALPNRTWVSGVGDDVNPCSRTAPCKTFAGAIAKTEAGGEIEAIDAAGYGTVIITKSITIDGTGVFAGVAAVSGSGITITNTPGSISDTLKVVRLRGLSINGLGTGQSGINVKTTAKVSIEDCVIDGFAEAGITCTAGSVFVRNTTIRNNKYGVSATAGQVALNDVFINYNSTGLGGTAGLIVTYNNVVLWGNTNGDPPPPRNR